MLRKLGVRTIAFVVISCLVLSSTEGLSAPLTFVRQPSSPPFAAPSVLREQALGFFGATLFPGRKAFNTVAIISFVGLLFMADVTPSFAQHSTLTPKQEAAYKILKEQALVRYEHQKALEPLEKRGFTSAEAEIVLEEQERLISIYYPKTPKNIRQRVNDITEILSERGGILLGLAGDKIKVVSSSELNSLESFRALVVHETSHILFRLWTLREDPILGKFFQEVRRDPHPAIYGMGYLRLMERGQFGRFAGARPLPIGLNDYLSTLFQLNTAFGYKLGQEAWAMEQNVPGSGWAFLGRLARDSKDLDRRELWWFLTSPFPTGIVLLLGFGGGGYLTAKLQQRRRLRRRFKRYHPSRRFRLGSSEINLLNSPQLLLRGA